MLKKIVLIIILLGIVVVLSTLCFWKHRQSKLRVLAIETFKTLNNNNVKYWADYGTLLGIVREDDIILHDTDADVCVLDTPHTHEAMRKCAHQIEGDFHLEYHPWGAYRFRYNKMPFSYIDIYLTKLQDGYYIDPTGKIPVELVGNTRKILWRGVEVNVPEKTHESLVWRYGQDYMTPKRFFDNKAKN